jgi:hypothetical protein
VGGGIAEGLTAAGNGGTREKERGGKFGDSAWGHIQQGEAGWSAGAFGVGVSCLLG